MSWKTAPRGDLLARYSDLGGYLVEAVPHTRIVVEAGRCQPSFTMFFLLLFCVSTWSAHLVQAPNGCVSHTKLVLALKECQALRPCFFTVNLDRDAGVFSMVMRILLSKFRSVQSDQRCKQVVRSKALVWLPTIS